MLLAGNAQDFARVCAGFMHSLDGARAPERLKMDDVGRMLAQEAYTSFVLAGIPKKRLALHGVVSRSAGKAAQPTVVVLDGTADCEARGSRIVVRDFLLRSRRSIKCQQGCTVLCLSEGYPAEAVFSGESDGTIRKYSALTGEYLGGFEGHTKMVTCLQYYPEERAMFSASADGTIRMWSLMTEECMHIMRGHSMVVTCIALSPKRDVIFSGSGDRTVKQWNARSGQLLGTIDHDMPLAVVKVNEKLNVLLTAEWGVCGTKFFSLDTCAELSMDALVKYAAVTFLD